MINPNHGGSLRPTTPIRSDSLAPQPGQEVDSAAAELVEYCAQRAGLNAFPNDLTRMLYLASLRDCNSGHYLHVQLTDALGVTAIDHALCVCHEQVFRRLLTTPLSEYAAQLQEYVRYTGADMYTVLNTWQSLGAYRATVPLRVLPIYGELFCLNIELAMAILQSSPL